MFWYKTYGLTVFLFLQLIVQFELKTVRRTDSDKNADDAEMPRKEDNKDGFERQEVIDEIKDIKKDEIEVEKVDIPYRLEEFGIPSNLVSKDNKKTKNTNKLERDKVVNLEKIDDADLDKSLESQDSTEKIKDIDKGEAEINEEKFPDHKTNQVQAGKKNAKKFGIPPPLASIPKKIKDISNINKLMRDKNKSKKRSPNPKQGENKDYALDDFWVDQPFDFYHYFESTTSKPKYPTEKFSLMDTVKPKSLKKLLANKFASLDKKKPKLLKKMKSKTKNMPPTQGKNYDYAFDDFWVDQPFDFYHYLQFMTARKPTTLAPKPFYEYYYDDEYTDAYDYTREYSQNISIIKAMKASI